MFLWSCALLLLSSCAHKPVPLGGDPGLQVLNTNVLPPPVGTDASGRVPYRIGTFDKLLIDVFGVQDFSREVEVDGSGNITYPLVGEIQAGGKTLGELSAVIANSLRGRYVRNPQVTVNLKEGKSQTVTVDGEVNKPGMYPVPPEMTLVRAVATAGGTTEFSKLDDVVIFRTVGEQRYVGLYNLQAIRRGNYADPRIYSSDVIVVGDSPGRRRFKDILSASSLLATPLVAILNRL
jgi:polysaccharide export outer membrane protein